MKQSKKKILDAIIIGMGFSGVCSAIKLLENKIDNFEIHEKSKGVGGTWNENIYPGAACDVPSHLYCFSFEPNPNWTRRYAKQPEIKRYIEHCVEKYNINKYANFSSKVISIQLIEKSSLWLIKFHNGNEIRAKHVIHAAGGIHKPTIPSFKNLSQYDGTVMHTAQWNNEVAIKDKRIAVIGSAASAIQVIPEIAKIASKVVVFQRTPNYIIPRGDRAYTDKEKMRFKRFPWLLKLYRWFFYMRLELLTFPIIKKNSFIGKKAAKNINKHMRSKIHDSSLHEYFEPKYDLGCKRILLSDDLFNAINRENVEVINSNIEYFNKNGHEIWKNMREIEPKGKLIHYYFAFTKPTNEEAIEEMKTLLRELVDNQGDKESLAVSGDHSYMEAPIYNTLGYLNYYIGEKIKSKDYFEKYIEAYPNGHNPYDSMGEFYFNEGDMEKAKSFYIKAIEMYPSVSNAKEMIKKINAVE